jgi:hypothetical protein
VSAQKTSGKTEKKAELSSIAFKIDFSKAEGNPVDWLKGKGFEFEKDASDLKLSFENGRLVIESPEPLLAVIINDKMNFKNVSKVRIKWGIIQYPEGASYEKKVNNEALMVYSFFGKEKFSSGSFFIPSSPYFIGLFLGKKDVPGKVYTGKHYTRGGRFVCAAAPVVGKTIVTEYNLANTFKSVFKENKVPYLSGISFEVDTSYLESGKAKAFIESIEYLTK